MNDFFSNIKKLKKGLPNFNKESFFGVYNLLLAAIFIVAFLLRAKVYLANTSLWLDECSLALSVINNHFFGALEYGQTAPSVFLLIVKLITLVFGFSEQALRFIPFLSSILSIFAFYYLTKLFLDKKFSILFVNFLFGVNYYLIYYAQEFKQYSSDVLVAILLLIALSKLKPRELKLFQCLGIGVIFALLFWLSYTSVFIIAGWILLFLSKNFKKVKNNLLLILPIVLNLGLYFSFNLSKSFEYLSDFALWKDGFINPNFSNFLRLVVGNCNYFFYPCKFTLFLLILFIIGAIGFFKSNKEKFILITFPLLAVIISSYMHLYPFQQRVVLFLIPIVLIIVMKPLDSISMSKKTSSLFLLLLLSAYFSGYFTLNYYIQIGSKSFYKLTDINGITKLLSVLINPEDTLVLSPSSSSSFDVYSNLYKITYARKVVGQMPDYNKDQYIEALNRFPSGKYWFYIAHDVSHAPIRPFIEEWSKNSCRTVKEYNRGDSFIIYVEK